jgi:hypothetical protein
MAAGRGDAALAEAKRAQALAGKSQNAVVKLATSITAARIQGLSRSPGAGAAVAELERAQAQASTLGLVPLRLEALLGLAEITARLDRAAADLRFAALEKEAGERGFGGVAARAAAGGTRSPSRASKE